MTMVKKCFGDHEGVGQQSLSGMNEMEEVQDRGPKLNFENLRFFFGFGKILFLGFDRHHLLVKYHYLAGMDGVSDSVMSGQVQHELSQEPELVTSNTSPGLINNPESLLSTSTTTDNAPSSILESKLFALPTAPVTASASSGSAAAAISEEETFKVPTLPPAHTRAIPADIAHIIAMGLNEPDPADEELAAGRGTSNYEQVVKEMREKAGFGTAKQESEEGKELESVEEEMKVRGVLRVTEDSGVEMEVEEEEEEDDVKPDVSNGDRQS